MSTYHVNQDVKRTFPLLHELRCIVLFPPLLLVVSKISFEGFLPPRTIYRIRDGRKGRTGFVLARILEELIFHYFH